MEENLKYYFYKTLFYLTFVPLTFFKRPWSDISNQKYYSGFANRSYSEFFQDVYDKLYYEDGEKKLLETIYEYMDHQIVYRTQRDVYGCDATETFSLDWNISRYILPRLKLFRTLTEDNVMVACPPNILDDQNTLKNIKNDDEEYEKNLKLWLEVLDKMIYSFSVDKFDDEESEVFDKYRGTGDFIEKMNELSQKRQEGLNLFAKHFNKLWD